MKSRSYVSKTLLLSVAACTLIAAAPAFAGFAQGNQVTMGGQPVFSIGGRAEGFSPDHRAWLAQDKLDNALVVAGDRSPSAVTVTFENGACVVKLDGKLVATADGESARLAGLRVHALAEQWAQGIRGFLSDTSKTDAYLAQLTGQNPINANLAFAERRLFAPPGTVLPVCFGVQLGANCLLPGQCIEGTVMQDVAIGNYMVPAKTLVEGKVVPAGLRNVSIAFTTLKSPGGTQIPINAVLTGPLSAAAMPTLVATIDMPYGDYPRYQGYTETNARVPAQIGIGTLGGGDRLVFAPGAPFLFPAGTPMSVVLQGPQQVAVISRTMHM
jgi:hypothetical protein